MRIKDYGETTFVTGLRAFACLGVLLIHAGGGGLRTLHPLGNALVDLGASGVTVFFVISGFSVSASLQRGATFWLYLFQRFMRLAPLYYFWFMLGWLFIGRSGFWAQHLGTPPWPRDLLQHLFFVHAWWLNSANSVLGVEWSMSVEFFWYLCLPLLWRVAGAGRGHWSVAFLLFAVFVWQVLWFRRLHQDDAFSLATRWHPLAHGFSFSLGVWAYVLRPRIPEHERARGLLAALALLLLYLLDASWRGAFVVSYFYAMSFFTFMLLLYATQRQPLVRVLFMNRAALFFGTLSYALYLTHMVALWLLEPWLSESKFLLAAAVLALATLLAYLSTRFIEQPSLRWGRRIGPLVNKSLG